ncbi:MAG TPA: ABC transporter permease [Noviherbaspirillum sp.]|nr:ABC transporter permease [Noviherbaspirillum sp.]
MKLGALTMALKSLRHRPLANAINMLLLAVGIAIMTFVLSAARQLEDAALRDARGIDLVVGAPGSPLQLILSSIYHIDIPTGNIPLAAQATLEQNRLVRKVIPLALGDSYEGFRIVGTTHDYAAHYGGQLAEGRQYQTEMEAVLGAAVAARTRLRPGEEFVGSHGLAPGGETHEEAPYVVTGILQPTGTVLDRLVLTSVESVWHVHEIEHGITEDDAEGKAAMEEDRELTALLVQYASPLAAATLPRLISSQSGLQAAQPAFESAKLFRMLGAGVDVLRAIAAIILLAAALSMFAALYNALEERKTDLAILRTLGAPPGKLFRLLLAEGLLLAAGGAALGWLTGHLALELVGRVLADGRSLPISGFAVAPDEIWLAAVALAIGLAAAALPALRAYRTEIATTLSR